MVDAALGSAEQFSPWLIWMFLTFRTEFKKKHFETYFIKWLKDLKSCIFNLEHNLKA